MSDHLVRQSHSWCFRMIVPGDLREVVGKSELRYTLYTGSRREAAKLSKLIVRKIKLLLAELRRDRMSLSQEQIDKIIREHLSMRRRHWVPNRMADSLSKPKLVWSGNLVNVANLS